MNTSLPFLERLQIQQYRIVLRLENPVHFSYFHGPALNGLLCNALNCHPLGPNLILHPVESGLIDYQKGDLYHFGLTLIGHCPDLAGQIHTRLTERGCRSMDDKTFGSFSVTAFERCQMAPLPREFPNEFTLQFVTPLRMERQGGTRGHQFFDTGYFDIGRFLRLLHDRAYDLCKLSQTDPPPYAVPEIPDIPDARTSLIWIDAPYHGCSKTFGGVVGLVRFRLEGADDWKRLLWWGQYIHAGRNSAFGFGRYLLNPGSAVCAPAYVQQALSVLDRVIKSDNLMEAFYHCKNNQGQAGADGQTLEAFETDLFCNLEKLSQALRHGTYRPDILYGILLPKSSGKIRALAVPTVKDRILQRAVTQILGASWDKLLEESSFAYRKGLSRVGAAKAIQKAYNEGFRWFLESDIESFFDNVNWDIMTDKVHSLLPSDPIADIIMSWLTQPVVFEGQILRRTCGLPQGAVISPLLANLYLDQFDESLGEDFRLIRYADDFVVLCKTQARAQEALETARKALEPLKLEIKPSKTKIGDFDQGFQYLGYLFCRSMVVEAEKENQDTPPLSIANLTAEQIPSGHWLTQVNLNRIKSIPGPETTPVVSLDATAIPRGDDRFPVYLTEPDIQVRLSSQALALSYRDRPQIAEIKIPFHKILAVIDYGRPSITLNAVARLSQAHIPTYFQKRTGETYLAVPAVLPDHALWLRQLQFQDTPPAVLVFIRAVVTAKINNYRVICQRHKWDSQKMHDMKDLEHKCAQATTIETIRGYEGRAAAIYFGLLARYLPAIWNFQGRIKHPPTDPVNAMLSFGYSCLYHHLATALQVCGLHPGIGWYHESRQDYLALACDLQEEFRFLVDGLVLSLLNKHMVTPDDFTYDQADHLPVIMSKSMHKTFLGQLEKRLLTPFKPDDNSEAMISYRHFFVRQARQIHHLCYHPEIPYTPLRIH